MILDLEMVDSLPALHRSAVPDEYLRRGLAVGAAARLVVPVNGQAHVPVWVAITRAQSGAYSGFTDHGYGAVPAGTAFEFTWQHVVDFA